MKTLVPVLLFFLFLSSSHSPLDGQTLVGRVLVSGDTIGVEGADLTLLDSEGQALLRVQSDSGGAFRMPVPGEGEYVVSVSRLGFSTLQAPIRIQEREMVEVELRMSEEAIPLEPLLVVARRRIREGTLDEFYDRMERMKQRGVGWFFTPEEIELRERMDLPTLLYQTPGVYLEPGRAVRMRNRGQYCIPTYYLDGIETTLLSGTHLMDLEGIEVYRGRFEHVEGYWPSDCGMIFLWRKEDWGNPFTWRRAFFAGGLLGLLLSLHFLI